MNSQFKKRIINYIDANRGRLTALSDSIHRNPELGFREFFAVQTLAGALRDAGFVVETGIAGLETAFRAEYAGGEQGPKIAFLAEYDALPGLGHACGHNLIGTASVGAALALRGVLDTVGGSVVVLGTPAEETGGGKVSLVEHGEFQDVDAAMMIHPADRYTINVTSLAMDALEFTFFGRSSHAAASPAKGRNALEGVIQLFNGINSLRANLRSDVRINGIIADGGKVPNIIPEKAVARFYVRCKDRTTLPEVVERVISCARGAAEITGTRVEWNSYEPSYDNMVTNFTLAKIFQQNLHFLGIEQVSEAREGMGSLDMGNVSRTVPAIHPYVAISPPGLAAHTKEFAEVAGSQSGHKGMLVGAKALALTGLALLTNPKIVKMAWEELKLNVKSP